MLSIILAGTLLFSVNPGQAESAQRNGFSIEDPIIPLEDILSGGPPRDGIPSIDSPKFISASEVDWLLPGSRILGLEINGVIRAYPLAILNWHEIVNDTVSGVPVAVTFCPLCGTGMAFRRDFGVQSQPSVSPDCFITVISCFMTERANHSGLKSWDKLSAVPAKAKG